MKRYVYFRCSTDHQDFLQQENCVRQYFARSGMDYNAVESIIQEKISGTVKHTDRKLSGLLDSCNPGDYIYISELSRLGRNMSDLFALVQRASDIGREEAGLEDERKRKQLGRELKEWERTPYGVTIIQCKDGTHIENNSVGGKAMLFALSIVAEIEVNNLRQRTMMGLDARREKLAKDGQFISNSGRVCTHFGREKGCDLSAANLASCQKRQDDAILWKETSKGYKWVRDEYFKGTSRADILERFNDYYEKGTDGFSTRSGKPLSSGVLSKWIADFQNPLAI